MRKTILFVILLSCNLACIAADNSTEAIQKRIEPVGQVNVEPAKQANPVTNKTIKSGEEETVQPQAVDGKTIYESKCVICHGTGVAGAPKFGDKVAWKPRIDQGMEKLVEHATKGLNAMPPKGTCVDCTDAQLKAAVEYMVKQGKE